MLPSSSSPTSSISSSDTDVVVMETAKADPLDLTCNSTAANANQPLRRTTANSPSSIETHSNANGPIQSTTTVRGVMSAPMAVTGAAAQPAASSNSTNEEAHRCDMCGKTFAVPARLTRHYRTHTGERPFVCEVCGKSFSVKENLSVHRRIHTKEKPYRCPHCGRGFEHSGKLHRHMRIHTGERPHQCNDCGKTFIQSGQLVIHMRSHTGEKPYVCSVCSKGFTCSKQLKVHSRTHTGERPYACDVCGKTFAYNHVLKLHQMAHLGERLYKCTICSETYSSKKALEAHIKMHGVSPTRQSPLPSTSSAVASSSGNASHLHPATANDQRLANTVARQRPGRYLTNGGIFLDQGAGSKRLVGQPAGVVLPNRLQNSSPVENNGDSPPSLEYYSVSHPTTRSTVNNTNLLMEGHRHVGHHQPVPWNMLNQMAMASRATSGTHHLTNSQYDDSQMNQLANNSMQERSGTNFAFPQLLNNQTSRERFVAAGLVLNHQQSVDQRQQQQHSFHANNHPANSAFKPTGSHQSQQSTRPPPMEKDSSTMTYLRPMPPLIPVTMAATRMTTSPPTLLGSLDQRANGNHSSSMESPDGVSATELHPIEGSSVNQNPASKSSRFRGGDGSTGDGGGNSESSDSQTSSASSSPSLMTEGSDSHTGSVSKRLRPTSVIKFAHRSRSDHSSSSSMN